VAGFATWHELQPGIQTQCYLPRIGRCSG